jgi:hypothetical protein
LRLESLLTSCNSLLNKGNLVHNFS